VQRAIEFDVDLMRRDMAERGWQPTDMAHKADVAVSTVTRFLRREYQTPRTAKKLAKALGRSVRRYLIPSEAVA
jgi:plasmid maintenance system antidote protein VapI